MQKRYCTCGQAVMVDYMFSNSMCDTMFRNETTEQEHSKGELLLTCPHCTTLLNINNLR
ncbi:hypothetical protein LJC48_00365 [Desulfovibrio sp. OttesenSCG-928-C06]|nr:hypothetical protein [Desulfovibrio sp. OttesenSCG-928-C06]